MPGDSLGYASQNPATPHSPHRRQTRPGSRQRYSGGPPNCGPGIAAFVLPGPLWILRSKLKLR
jgi:hypothetical protein